MKSRTGIGTWAIVALASTTVAACGGADGGSGGSPSDKSGVQLAEGDSHPAAAVTVTLKTGQQVEFYDYPEGVLVMESGQATRSTEAVLTTYRALIKGRRYAELFSALRPDLQVPDRILELQQKVGGPSDSVVGAFAPEEARPDVSGPTSGGSPWRAPDACSNICCDETWLNNNICYNYNNGGYPYSWFLVDYGWSYADNNSVSYYSGTACAGIGTSTFVVTVGTGSGGTWTVGAGYYRTYWWEDGCGPFGCSHSEVYSSVNTESDQHLHSYCGVFNW